ncbi:hypothetical protein HDU99_007142, partial [Rhizoclosmatium hyalinum]
MVNTLGSHREGTSDPRAPSPSHSTHSAALRRPPNSALKVAECSTPLGFRAPEDLAREVQQRQRNLALQVKQLQQKQHDSKMQQQQQTIHQFQLHKSPAATAILAADSQRPFNPNTIKQQILAKRKLEHPPPPPSTDNLPDPTSSAAGAATKSVQPNQPSRADIQEYMKQQIKRRHKEVMQQKLAEAKQKEEIKK